MSRSASYTPRDAAVSRFRRLFLLIAMFVVRSGASDRTGTCARFRLTRLSAVTSLPLRPRSQRAPQYSGGVAQLGGRVKGIHEARGSMRPASTRGGWAVQL